MLSANEKDAFLDSIKRVRDNTVKHLSAGKDVSFAINFVATLHRAVDKVAQQASVLGPKPECVARCTYCCYVRVEVTEPEIFRIARELKNRPLTQISVHLERLRKHVTAVQVKKPNTQRMACAFLENNLCSIYEVRPAVCRKAHSLSVERCESFASEIPQNFEIILGAEALMKGSSDAYRQINLCSSSHELCSAVLLAMKDETAEARWYAGESVFSDEQT